MRPKGRKEGPVGYGEREKKLKNRENGVGLHKPRNEERKKKRGHKGGVSCMGPRSIIEKHVGRLEGRNEA